MSVVFLTTLNLIFICISNCCATSPVAVDPRSTTVMEGTNVTLYCTIIKNSSEAVSWTSSHSLSVLSIGRKIVREGLVSSSQPNRLSISGNSDLGEYNLNFQNVQPEDVGQYSCGYFSVSQRQAIFSSKAVLTVISPPVCEHYPPNLELAPGNSIQMVCTSQNNRPNTDLTWLRNGQSLRSGTRVGQAELSNTISYLLTEDDYDQRFTCIESMSPLSYVPHCSITPLRQTLKPVHIANFQEVVTVGGISHLTCLINPSLDSLSYRWLVDSNLTSSTSKIYSFGPVSIGDNGTSITCEVHRDGEFYGRDEMVIIVTPEPEAAYIPVIVDTITPTLVPSYSPSVHIVHSPNMVTVGGISHLTCFINESIDSLSYRWYVYSNLVLSSGSTFNFGPVLPDDNGTNISCEVSYDGLLYGSDNILVIVKRLPLKTCMKNFSGSKKRMTAKFMWVVAFLVVFLFCK